jgi:preprotein translocase subunit SecD
MRRAGALPLVFIVVVAAAGLTAALVSGSSPQLGLDLQGGISVVLQPKEDPPAGALDQAIEIIRTRVDALGVAEPEIARQGDAVVVQLPGVRNQRRALDIVGQTAELRFRPVLGDVLSGTASPPGDTSTTTVPGGTTTTVAGTTTVPPPATTTTAAPTSTSEGALGESPRFAEGESAAAPLPGGDTTTTTAPATTTTSGGATTTAGPTTTAGGATTTSSVPQIELEDLCPIPEPEDDDPEQEVFLPQLDDDGNVVNCFHLGPSRLTGSALESATARIPQGQWIVDVVFKGGEDGIDGFNIITGECYSAGPTCPTGQLAIVLDGVVKSAPKIQQPSYERNEIVIEGSFEERSAKDLALVLRYGALPVELEPQTVQTVSASLGRDSLRAGVAAGIGGLILVALYMILYYRALGLVVVVGLTVWGSLNFALICWLSETQGLALSLAGVTGIIVSIGVTVDSYVVYFERLKDELRAGRTLRSSTDRAFRRAFRTILAADTSSFIGAALLYWLTVGPVRGFAFFLGVSTILDVIVAWFFTRPLVGLLSRNHVFTDMRFLGVARGLGRAAPVPAGGGGS